MFKHSLEKVRIHGFRGLRNLSLEGLGALNILVGANNCGKTSALEAMSILCNPHDPNEWFRMIRRRDFGGLDETRIQSLRWCFGQSGDLADPDFVFQSSCDMQCEGAFPLRTLHVEYKDIVGRPDEDTLNRIFRHRTAKSDAVELNEEWNGAELSHFVQSVPTTVPPTLFDDPIVVQFWEEDRVGFIRRPGKKRMYLPTATLTPYSYQINELQIRTTTHQMFRSWKDGGSGPSSVLDLIQQFDPNIADIRTASFRGKRPAIYINHKKLGPAPLSVFGDALRRAVLLANTINELQGGGVLLIDEIETGIHVSALQRVFAWLADAARLFNVQVFATTHSLEALDAIAESVPDRIDDLVTFHLEQTDTETLAKRIEGDLLIRLRRERGLDVR